MKFLYCIELNNYMGDSSFEVFHHEENAKARFEELLAEAKTKAEFYYYEAGPKDKNYCLCFSFFDANYNSDSTFITLSKIEYKKFFQDEE